MTELCLVFSAILALFCLGVNLMTLAAASAKSTACMFNLNRIGQAAYSYSQDYGDYSIPHRSGNIKGWVHVLSAYEKKLTPDSYHCPEDRIKRNFNGRPISFSLNTGHIWNVPQTNTNIKEWGMVSPVTGTSVMLSQAPEPSDTAWFFEFWNENNNFSQLWNSNDRAAFSSYTLYGFHENGKDNTLLFVDGHIDSIPQKEWKTGDSRGILYKNLHTVCNPNLP